MGSVFPFCLNFVKIALYPTGPTDVGWIEHKLPGLRVNDDRFPITGHDLIAVIFTIRHSFIGGFKIEQH